jgi:ubiquinone/menaquinone biosynthesis C-methylase UbiE
MNPDCAAIEGSSTSIPGKDGSYDLVIICAMTHHLSDEDLQAPVDEAARVLRPAGHLLFLDALWELRRLRGRTPCGASTAAAIRVPATPCVRR